LVEHEILVKSTINIKKYLKTLILFICLSVVVIFVNYTI